MKRSVKRSPKKKVPPTPQAAAYKLEDAIALNGIFTKTGEPLRTLRSVRRAQEKAVAIGATDWQIAEAVRVGLDRMRDNGRIYANNQPPDKSPLTLKELLLRHSP